MRKAKLSQLSILSRISILSGLILSLTVIFAIPAFASAGDDEYFEGKLRYEIEDDNTVTIQEYWGDGTDDEVGDKGIYRVLWNVALHDVKTIDYTAFKYAEVYKIEIPDNGVMIHRVTHKFEDDKFTDKDEYYPAENYTELPGKDGAYIEICTYNLSDLEEDKKAFEESKKKDSSSKEDGNKGGAGGGMGGGIAVPADDKTVSETSEPVKADTQKTSGTKKNYDEEVKKLTKALKMKISTENLKKGIKVKASVKKGSIKKIKNLGYTVEYKFYRSYKKSSGYKKIKTKSTNSLTNTSVKKGKRYYYKVVVSVKDKKGKEISKTVLKQCSYGTRLRK